MYHRVTELSHDPYGVCVHPENFASQLDCIRDYADIVPLSSIGEASTDRRVVITFDDGYADNAWTAKPILEAAQAFATIFVVTGKIDSTKEFWWDKLEQLMSPSGPMPSGPIDVNVGERISIRLQLESTDLRERTLWTLHGALMPLPPATIDDFLQSLGFALHASTGERGTHRPLSLLELIDLNASSLIEIGAHSASHPMLPALSARDQSDEIAGSRSRLQDLLNAPVSSFAYPFGEYDDVTLALVERAGLELACTADPGKVTASTSPLEIPRHEVLNWSRQQFADRLKQWMEE
jgi:peptidoglycan/xylan/chitin deacetylase (PgdA/CDA1 family)